MPRPVARRYGPASCAIVCVVMLGPVWRGGRVRIDDFNILYGRSHVLMIQGCVLFPTGCEWLEWFADNGLRIKARLERCEFIT